MEKRLVLAIVLSVCTMVIFQQFIQPKKTVSPIAIENTQSIADSPIPQVDIPRIEPLADEQQGMVSGEEITTLESDKFLLQFSNNGANLKNVILKEYNVTLAEINGDQEGIFSLTLNGERAGGAPFSVEQHNGVVKYYREYKEKGIAVEKTYYAEEGKDTLNFDLTIYNLTNAPVTVDYTLVGASGIANDSENVSTDKESTKPIDKNQMYIETDAELNGKVLRKNKISSSKEYYGGIISWVALKNRYFAIALKTQKDCAGYFISKDNDQRLSIGVESGKKQIAAGGSLAQRYQLYLGPIQKSRIAKLNLGMEGLVNYGFFGIISIFLLQVLTIVHAVVHNWGVSIIIVTIGLNILLFPLTVKSFASMKKMQELQPHLEKLRELHKDNPQKLNKEMMELYKQYNLNPFGGCLPMLLQMPIFVAFYQTLMKAIELKGATFLWIKDLSSPDAFILFPQAYPLIGDKLNLLPIITLIVMIVQQKTSMASNAKAQSPEMQQQQKMMGILFPIIFIVMLYNFSSGLILYWLTNSVAMTTEQFMFFHRKPKTV